jgi:hypothetical protein
LIARKEEFTDMRINLDGGTYEGCTFRNCTLLYNGILPVSLNKCFFENCVWDFIGPAGNALAFMTSVSRSRTYSIRSRSPRKAVARSRAASAAGSVSWYHGDNRNDPPRRIGRCVERGNQSMNTMEIFDPSGATEITQLHADRLGSLEGKTVAMLSDDMWQAHRMMPLLREMLEERYDNITIIPETEFPMGNTAIDRDETADMFVERGVDAVIVGNAS